MMHRTGDEPLLLVVAVCAHHDEHYTTCTVKNQLQADRFEEFSFQSSG